MDKILSKEDVDKLLDIDPNTRLATCTEMDAFLKEYDKISALKGEKNLTDDEVIEILRKLNLEHIEIRSEKGKRLCVKK
jgi:hypothetical protein